MLNKTLLTSILFGILIGGVISTFYVSAITWPNLRGNMNIASVDGSLMVLFEKIFVDTGSLSGTKVKNTQKLAGVLDSGYQRRVINQPTTCLESTDSIVEIQSNGTAVCRSRLPGICGTASGSSFLSIPSTDLCDGGSTPSSVVDESVPVYPNSGPYTWTCTRGTTVSCQAESEGKCNTAFVGRCQSGSPTHVNVIPKPTAHCGGIKDYKWWDCRGSDGSSDRCTQCD